MNVYADTSFLVSLFTADANSAAAIQRIQRRRLVMFLTDFGELELANAVQLRVFRGEITTAQAAAAMAALANDIRAGIFRLEPITSAAYERALKLASAHTAKLGTRTGDVLHVSIALELKADWFYTFDKRQATLASAEGLKIL